jgi:hypothetical protein
MPVQNSRKFDTLYFRNIKRGEREREGREREARGGEKEGRSKKKREMSSPFNNTKRLVTESVF